MCGVAISRNLKVYSILHPCNKLENKPATATAFHKVIFLSYMAFLAYGAVLYAVIGISLVHGGMGGNR